jgi:hypothetical protein
VSEEAQERQSWLDRHANAIQALSAIGMFLLAGAALVAVKVQVDAAERTQREQSARDIYREVLSLSIAQPALAKPNYCAIVEPQQRAAYENYVNYMLYASEQVLDSLPDWEQTLDSQLLAHRDLFCSERDWTGDTPEVKALLDRFRGKHCTGYTSPCGGDDGEAEGS